MRSNPKPCPWCGVLIQGDRLFSREDPHELWLLYAVVGCSSAEGLDPRDELGGEGGP